MMKQVSAFEKIAARCWNLLNEGKPFLPIFTIGTFLLFHSGDWGSGLFWISSMLGLTAVLPLLAVYIYYDFPLMLRNYLWIPLVVYLLIWQDLNLGLSLFALGLYFFFTVFFWGTLYYHLRIGTTWLNFTRFWKLVLKHSDSTSGNAQEQMPKFILLLALWEAQHAVLKQGGGFMELDWPVLLGFTAGIWLYAWILHRYLFDWKPKEITPDRQVVPEIGKPLAKRVITIVIDGMRKERFEEANTPFLDQLRLNGTEVTRMETVYPARTVVCFSSMFTGTYPEQHGIKSNMVWKLGVRTETIFDSLRKAGKTGRLLGIAHLIDAMGDDVDSITAVMHNDEADRNIIERAKRIMEEKNPDMLALQLIGTDQTGHSRGVFYDEYIQKIEEADRLVEEFVGWLESKKMMDDTVLIICADHGQADGIGGHGHLDEGERYVPFFINGPCIEQGKRIDNKQSLVSLAPTIAYLMGVPYPRDNRGSVLIDAVRKEG
jgi:hypothetical protein